MCLQSLSQMMSCLWRLLLFVTCAMLPIRSSLHVACGCVQGIFIMCWGHAAFWINRTGVQLRVLFGFW